MSINLNDLSPEDLANLSAQIEERNRLESADQRAKEEMDKSLRVSWQERGHSVGCQWEDPEGRPERAFPFNWTVQDEGHWWQSKVPVNMTKPGFDNPTWEINDPIPENEDAPIEVEGS